MVCAVCSAARLSTPAPPEPLSHLYDSANQLLIKDGNGQVMAVGLARYDSDRGGAQEDDRIGQYRETAREVIGFANSKEMSSLKVIFINDGPGLLAGSMWDDYGRLDQLIDNRVRVATLRMVPERITQDWLGL